MQYPSFATETRINVVRDARTIDLSTDTLGQSPEPKTRRETFHGETNATRVTSDPINLKQPS